MDEFYERCGVDMARASVATRAGREQNDERPKPLSAARNDVFGDLINQGDRAFHAGADHGIDGQEILTNQLLDRGQQRIHGVGW